MKFSPSLVKRLIGPQSLGFLNNLKSAGFLARFDPSRGLVGRVWNQTLKDHQMIGSAAYKSTRFFVSQYDEFF